MKKASQLLAVGTLLISATAAVNARDFLILVGTTGAANGTPSLTFFPDHLPNQADETVKPGDTITFRNAFATGFHNAHSLDSAFLFSCGSQGCESSSANSGSWSATVTVPESAAGHTIQYQCDAHGTVADSSGMIGSIDVSASTPVVLQAFEVN